MPVTLINNCVAMPHVPNWGTRAKWRRRWATSLADGVTGAEDRYAHRAKPRVSLNWSVMPYHLQERARLADRVRAALKLGKAAVPYWGRGQSIIGEVTIGTTSVNLTGSVWTWMIGDYLFFCDRSKFGEEAWEAIAISAVSAGPVLTLASAVSRTYRDLCWPMLFGRLSCNDLSLLTNHHAEVPLSVETPIGVGALAEANCPDVAEPEWFEDGAAPPAGDCGSWLLLTCESAYKRGIPQELNPNGVLSDEEKGFAVALFQNELDIFLEATAEFYEIKRMGRKYWNWYPNSTTQKSLIHKFGSGVTDPTDPEGDVLVLFNSGNYSIAQQICVEPLP